jgi:hypothetical protein
VLLGRREGKAGADEEVLGSRARSRPNGPSGGRFIRVGVSEAPKKNSGFPSPLLALRCPGIRDGRVRNLEARPHAVAMLDATAKQPASSGGQSPLRPSLKARAISQIALAQAFREAVDIDHLPPHRAARCPNGSGLEDHVPDSV